MKYAYGNYSLLEPIDSKYSSKFLFDSGNKWIKPIERNSPPLNAPDNARTHLFSLNAANHNGIEPKIITSKNMTIITGILMHHKQASNIFNFYNKFDFFLNNLFRNLSANNSEFIICRMKLSGIGFINNFFLIIHN